MPHQLVVRALLLYPSVFQNDDPVRIHNRLELVGDDDDGASLDKRVDGFLHLHLVFRVERCGRFVQQDDRRILQDGAGDGYALLLATGERAAAFAHHRVVSLRQRMMKSWQQAFSAAAMTSSSVAPGFPKRILSRIVS